MQVDVRQARTDSVSSRDKGRLSFVIPVEIEDFVGQERVVQGLL